MTAPAGPCVRCGQPCPLTGPGHQHGPGRRQLCPGCDTAVDALIAAWRWLLTCQHRTRPLPFTPKPGAWVSCPECRCQRQVAGAEPAGAGRG